MVYGNSPALAAAEQALRAQPGLRVIHIDPAQPTATEELAALGEGVLLYDARTVAPEVIAAIHVLHPRLPTVGLGDRDGRELALLGRMVAPAWWRAWRRRWRR